MKLGIYDMSDREYRAIPNMLNASSIPHLLQSPAHYLSNLTRPRESTKEMNFGSAVHLKILEPEKFNEQFVVKNIDLRTIKGKKDRDEIELVHKKKAISEEDFERIKYMEANIRRHEIASQMLTGGHSEQVIIFKLQASNGTEVACKAKVDYVGNNILVDLKTTKNAEPNSFNDSIGKYSYEIQGAFYSHAIEMLGQIRPQFYFVAVESEPPFAVSVIRLSESDYSKGHIKIYRAVNIFEECLRLNTWPSYEAKIYESKTRPWV